MTRFYEATHRQYDHTGYIMPEIDSGHSDFPFISGLHPAPWLPVQRYDKKMEVYSVCAPGKPVAVDKQGCAVPAGMKLAFENGTGTTVLTYLAADATEGTIDLTTGAAVTGAVSYDQSEVTAALRARGLILATEYARDFIGNPIGYAPYNYWQWAGGSGSNPAEFRHHNFQMQHKAVVGTDRMLTVPIVPAAVSTETMGDGSISSSAMTFGTTQWHNATGINATTRYASAVAATDNVVAYVFATLPVAKITANTPITDSGSTLASMTEVSSIADVIAGGGNYFYIDYDAGVMFLYEDGGDAVPTGFTDGTSTITYYSYESSPTGSADIVQFLGNCRPGDFVTFDSTSNYVKWVPDIGTCSGGASGDVFAADPDYGDGADATISGQLEAFVQDSVERVVGQVVAIQEWPRGGLEKVMTHYTVLGTPEKMPGTATQGYSDALNLSGGANRVAIINFLGR